MKVRFVDVSDRFKFETGTVVAGKDFRLKIWKGGFWTAAEARVKLESSGVEIRPIKGELIVNDQPVQVSAKLASLDTVCLRADERKSETWQYQEDFAAAKRARREKEKAEGLGRLSPRSEEGDKIAKAFAHRIKINEQGIEIRSFFGWKQLSWDQLDWMGFQRSATGGGAGAAGAGLAGGLIGGLIAAAGSALVEAARNRMEAAEQVSEFTRLFDRGRYDLRFHQRDTTGSTAIQQLPAASCVVLCELLEEYAPFDVVRSD